jgi:glycosyltransferase involved in cell wall biosynthesis
MKSLLTICIPTFNRAALLEEALKSLMDDGLLELGYEVIVSDNASPDDTEQRVARLREEGVPARYFRQSRNVGYSLNVVEAAMQADAEYIWFFGDDDLIEPGTLRKIQQVLLSDSPQIVYLNHRGFSETRRGWGNVPAHPEVDQKFTNGMPFFAKAGLGFLSALILRRQDFVEVVGKVIPSRNNAQIETAARIALKGKGPFILLGTVKVRARIDANGGGNILTDGFVHPCEIYQDLVDEGLLPGEYLKKWKRTSILRQILRRSLFYLCNGAQKKFFDAFEPLKKSFGDDPIFAWTVGVLPKIPIFLLKVPYRILHLIVSRLRLPLFRLLNAISPRTRS